MYMCVKSDISSLSMHIFKITDNQTFERGHMPSYVYAMIRFLAWDRVDIELALMAVPHHMMAMHHARPTCFLARLA